MAPMIKMTLDSVTDRVARAAAQAAIYRREMKTADHTDWLAINQLLFKVEEELHELLQIQRVLARLACAAFESAPIRFTDDVVTTD